jgi:hypothetical protein
MRRGIALVCFLVLIFSLEKDNFTIPVIGWGLLGFASLTTYYFRMRTMPKTGGAYRILVSDQYLIRESSHEWFGKPFRIPLSSISELIVEEDWHNESSKKYFFIRLADSSKVKIVPDYGFSPEAMFDGLLKLGVVTSISRK